jgi:CBS-domain-containing membrane protein
MKVSDVMTRTVISVSPQSLVVDAAKLMLKHRISGLPVIDDANKLVGIITEDDLLHRPETGTEPKRSSWLEAIFGVDDGATGYVRSHGVKVQEVMTPDPVTTSPDASLAEAVHVMESHKVKRLPVVSRRKVVGIISRANLVRALVSVLRSTAAPSNTDVAIRDRIFKAIDQQNWSSGAMVDVVVRRGVADLWGTILNSAQRRALKVLVESTAGVKQVEDHMTVAEPVVSFP